MSKKILFLYFYKLLAFLNFLPEFFGEFPPPDGETRFKLSLIQFQFVYIWNFKLFTTFSEYC